MQGNAKIIIFILVLLLVAAGGGYAIWRNKTAILEKSSPDGAENPIALLATFPTATSTPEEMELYRRRIEKFAEDGDTIDVTGCIIEPFALRVKRGENVNFINTAQERINLRIGNTDIYIVPPGGLVAEAEFGTIGNDIPIIYLCRNDALTTDYADYGFILIQ